MQVIWKNEECTKLLTAILKEGMFDAANLKKKLEQINCGDEISDKDLKQNSILNGQKVESKDKASQDVKVKQAQVKVGSDAAANLKNSEQNRGLLAKIKKRATTGGVFRFKSTKSNLAIEKTQKIKAKNNGFTDEELKGIVNKLKENGLDSCAYTAKAISLLYTHNEKNVVYNSLNTNNLNDINLGKDSFAVLNFLFEGDHFISFLPTTEQGKVAVIQSFLGLFSPFLYYMTEKTMNERFKQINTFNDFTFIASLCLVVGKQAKYNLEQLKSIIKWFRIKDYQKNVKTKPFIQIELYKLLSVDDVKEKDKNEKFYKKDLQIEKKNESKYKYPILIQQISDIELKSFFESIGFKNINNNSGQMLEVLSVLLSHFC